MEATHSRYIGTSFWTTSTTSTTGGGGGAAFFFAQPVTGKKSKESTMADVRRYSELKVVLLVLSITFLLR
jgi:hypothetical protein